jgi:hypothetical protein
MHDPGTQIFSFGPFALWHEDPCRGPGGDDSCGWFMRAHHGDPVMLEKIRRAIEHNFDRVFEYRRDDWDDKKKHAGVPPDSVHHMGYFCPNGDPNYSVHGIVLNMFWDAVHVYFNHDWKKSRPWMRKHLFDLLIFAENPTDSLRDGIVGVFRSGREKYDREEKIDNYARCIYGWILREQRPWYRHPRWHIHHWRPQVYWRWFVPRWLQRMIWPQNFASTSAGSEAKVLAP